MTAQDKVFTRCAWRLIPLIMVLYVVNYVDRVNVGFAALTMNEDLGFSPEIYGFGAGVFFISYLLFQIPANVLLGHLGARLWISLIIAAWGVVSAATAFVQGPVSFAIVRFLLGVAEAGFFPGIMFYLTLWFPQAYRARLSAYFIAAQPLAFIAGGPLSALILDMDGIAGLHGWQWLFLIEGLPAVILALGAWRWLSDDPARAKWLHANERAAIAERLRAESPAEATDTMWSAFCEARVWLIAVPIFAAGLAQNGVAFWMPQIASAMGFSNFETGLIVAATYFTAMVAIILVAYLSDRLGERLWHVVTCWLIAACGFIAASLSPTDIGVLVALALAISGVLSAIAPSFALPTTFLKGPASAGAMALMNTFASLGGFFAPILIGVLRERTGYYGPGMAMLAIALVLAALLVLAAGRAMNVRRVQVA